MTDFVMTLGWIIQFMGDMGEETLHRKESNYQTKKLKSGWGPAPRRSGRQTVRRYITRNLTCVIALQNTGLSSHQRGRLT
jgi:hypothetical protein